MLFASEKIDRVLKMAREYYALPYHGSGGSLHIVLDDGNVRHEDVEFCLDWAQKLQDAPGVKLAEELLTLTEMQREIVYERLHFSYEAPPGLRPTNQVLAEFGVEEHVCLGHGDYGAAPNRVTPELISEVRREALLWAAQQICDDGNPSVAREKIQKMADQV